MQWTSYLNKVIELCFISKWGLSICICKRVYLRVAAFMKNKICSICFLAVAFYYFFSSQVRRSICYGDQPRNRYIWLFSCCSLIFLFFIYFHVWCIHANVFCRLDLYLPTNFDGLKPVLIFVTGGAWIIGLVSIVTFHFSYVLSLLLSWVWEDGRLHCHFDVQESYWHVSFPIKCYWYDKRNAWFRNLKLKVANLWT